MRSAYKSVAISGAVVAVLGVLQLYIRLGEIVATDVSTWNLMAFLSVFLIVIGTVEVGWAVQKIRSLQRIGEEERSSAVARVPIWGGEYVVTDDVIYLSCDDGAAPSGLISTFRNLYRTNPRVVGLTLAFLVGSWLAGLGMLISGLIVEVLPFRLFLPFLYAFVGAGLLSMATIGGFAFWHWLTLRRRLRAELGTTNRTYDDAIPVDTIEFVAFDRHLGRPAMHIKHRQTDANAVQVAYLREEASEHIEQAESAFRSVGVPIRYVEDPFPVELAS